MTETTTKPPTKQIIAVIAKAFDVKPEDITGPSRSKHVVEARQVAIVLISKLRGASSTEIGRTLKRDHSTVLHNLRAFHRRAERSPKLVAVVVSIERRLLSGPRDKPTEADFEVLARMAPRKRKTPPRANSEPSGNGRTWDDGFSPGWWSKNDRKFCAAMVAAHPELFVQSRIAAE